MNREMEAKQTALTPESAARTPAGERKNALGAAALRAARQAERALDGLRVADGQPDHPAALSPVRIARRKDAPPHRRAALHHVLRR